MTDALNEAREAQPYADLSERLHAFEVLLADCADMLEKSDDVGDNVLGNDLREVQAALPEAAEAISTLLDRCIALEGALEQNATALNVFIYIIAQNFDGDGSYYWMRPPTHDEAQAAMEATVLARATLLGTSK